MKSIEKFGFSYERKEIANQIKESRRAEKENSAETYKFHRTGKEELYIMGGMRHLFDYIRTLPSHKILDVGTGTGNATHMVSQMPIAANLDFEVTALHMAPELTNNFLKDKIHITGVETLRGIKDRSLAAVIGLNSLAYSINPWLAAQRLDKVLISGGIVKATFCALGRSEYYNGLTFQDPEDFIMAFTDLDYDIFFTGNEYYESVGRGSMIKGPYAGSILLAIKPGNPDAPKAEELLNSDLQEIRLEKLRDQDDIPVFDLQEG